LRKYYPELKKVYADIRKGRAKTPLRRDVVIGIQDIVRANPIVFDRSVIEVIDEVAKPVFEPKPISIEEAPAARSGQKLPTPPLDSGANVDLSKTREFVFATIANRIWKLVLQGKDLPKDIEGWHKVYEQIRPLVGHILSWLRDFILGGAVPPPPPTISA
jgi:hypothetical protein